MRHSGSVRRKYDGPHFALKVRPKPREGGRFIQRQRLGAVEEHRLRRSAGEARGALHVETVLGYIEIEARHLDGAIRSYTPMQWKSRLEPNVNISNFGKQAERRKVWRVDGDIRPELWYEMINNFFRGNFTVAEYFGLPDPIEARELANNRAQKRGRA